MAKSRRNNEEGSFSKRKDGRWQGSQRFNGQRYFVYGRARQEAREKLIVKMAEVKEGKRIVSTTMTVREYLLKYLEVRTVDYKAAPLQGAGYVLRNQVIPTIIRDKKIRLGDLPLCELTFDDVQELVMQWRTRGLKGRTICDYFSYFRTAINRAAKLGMIAANPCKEVTLPRIEKTKRTILSREQIIVLLGILKDHWFLPIFIIFLATGLRKGELIALRWEDIDFEAGMLHVRHSVTWVKGKGYVEDTPKTESGVRSIVLHPFVIQVLEKHRIDQEEQRWLAGEHWKEHGLVFTRPWGDHVRPNTLNYAFTAKLKRADIPHTVIHDLRHTTATQLLSMKINPVVVAEVLGHRDASVTLGVYGHCLQGDHGQAMLELGDAFWAQSILPEPKDVKKDVADEDYVEGVWREVS